MLPRLMPSAMLSTQFSLLRPRLLSASRLAPALRPAGLAPRPLSTIPTSFQPGGPEPPSLYPQQPQKQRSASAEFYRALVPSMLHCLALGSIVYYAMELGWMWLKREKEGVELSERVKVLEEELERERRRGAVGTKAEAASSGGSWWKLW
ncbi:hypothetical protein JCM11641_006797 [Rhodosporidiobolus odoratus]